MKKISTYLFWPVFASVFVAAIYLRFANVHLIGMDGHDVFQYYDFSIRLLEDRPYLLFYRPLVYGLFALSFKVLGFTDYAPKVVVNIFDVINLVLIFLLSLRILRDRFASLSVVTVYAFLHPVLAMTRGELCHIFSLTFVLLFCIFQIRYFHRQAPVIAIFLCGMAVGLAFHTHEELLVLLGLSGLMIFIFNCFCTVKSNYLNYRNLLKGVLKDGLILGVGAAIPVLIGLSYFGFNEVYSNLTHSRGYHKNVDDNFISIFLELLPGYFHENVGILFTNLYLVALGVLVLLFLARKVISNLEVDQFNIGGGLLPVIFIATTPLYYVLVYSILVGNLNLPRLFFPFIPLVLLTVMWAALKLASLLRFPQSGALFLLLSVLFAYNQNPVWVLELAPSTHRVIYDELKTKVSNDAKLLVPIALEGRGAIWGGSLGYGVMGRMYFGDNAVSLFNLREQGSFEEIVSSYKIKYVFVSEIFNDYRKFDKPSYFSKVFSTTVSEKELENKDVVLNLEKTLLVKKIEQLGGVKLVELTGKGTIFKLP